MQEIFDSKFIASKKSKQTDFRLYEAVYNTLLEAVEDAKFFYGINPKKIALLNEGDEGADCILAPLSLHKQNDITNALKQIKAKLNKNGLFAGNFFGLNNLQELGELLAKEDVKHIGQPLHRMLPLMDIKTVGGLLQGAGFSQIVASNEVIEFEFTSLKEALHFLQSSGESNSLKLRDKTLLGGNVLKKYIASFQNPFTLKFDVCFFSCLNI